MSNVLMLNFSQSLVLTEGVMYYAYS
jgi:hypothetical protein